MGDGRRRCLVCKRYGGHVPGCVHGDALARIDRKDVGPQAAIIEEGLSLREEQRRFREVVRIDRWARAWMRSR